MLRQIKETVASAISSDPLYAYKVDATSATLCGRSYIFERCDAVVRADGKKVSIFTLSTKRLLERCSADEALAFVKTVKDGVALLTHLRHPGILSIEGPLVEEKKKIWFVTERVSMVLATETVQGLPLQVKLLGLARCAEAISFLHEKAELLLLNFALSSIYVTHDKRWKIGDLCFAVPRAQLMKLPPLPFSFRSVAAPLLDYLPTEFVDFHARPSSGLNNLFSGGSLPLVFPESDTYGFLVVTVEAMEEKRLFHCGGDPTEHQRQLASAEARVSHFFPPGALRLPRPPISTVIVTGPFATADMKTLMSLTSFDTLDGDARFRLLKSLYDGLSQNLFCEAVVLSEIVPLMMRESAVEAMLQFVLPILLLCSSVVSEENFTQTMREFFVSLLTAIIRAPSLERTSVYAEQILQKRSGIAKHFAGLEDTAALVIPLILKLMQGDGNQRIQRGSLEWLHETVGRCPTMKLGLPSDIAARLIHTAMTNSESFALSFQCLENILCFASTETKKDAEANLTRSITNSAVSLTSLQLDYLLRLLKNMQEQMSPEHRALQSIPLLCPLLLHQNGTVREYAVSAIVGHAQRFGGPTHAWPAFPSPPPSTHPAGLRQTSGITPNGESSHVGAKSSDKEDIVASLFS